MGKFKKSKVGTGKIILVLAFIALFALASFITIEISGMFVHPVVVAQSSTGLVCPYDWIIFEYQGVYYGANNLGIASYYSDDFASVTNGVFSSLGTTGGAVYLQSGTYTQTSTINLVNNLVFYGAGSTSIIVASGSANPMFQSIDVTGYSNITIKSITMNSNNIAEWSISGDATGGTKYLHLTITECTFTNPVTGEYGGLELTGSYINFYNNYVQNIWIINIENGAYNNFIGNTVINTWDSRVSCGDSNDYITCHDYVVSNNILIDTDNSQQQGYGIDIFGGISNVVVSGNTIIGSHLSGITVEYGGIYAPSNVAITGNTISDTEVNGIDVSGQNCTINSNTISNLAGYGINIVNSYNIASNNNIHDCSIGIYIYPSMTQNVITGNICRHCSYGLDIGSGASYTIVTGNNFLNNSVGNLINNGANTVLTGNLS